MGCIRYTATAEVGTGGFTIMGDTQIAMGIVSDCTLERPCIIEESVDERGIDIGRYYEGSVGYYGDGYFQTSFKKCYGVTPGELRRELRGNRYPSER